jgi:multicomponent Na+:H+ antiporter subunit E
MALIWLGLNGTDWASWTVGGPVVLASAWISMKLLPATTWRGSWAGAVPFAVFFLHESVRGGWDVARRALSPGLRLTPAIMCYVDRLPPGPARLFFCSVISLLPGTAVVAIAEKSLRIHVLDSGPQAEAELQELERRVAALFGHRLPASKEDPQ